MAEITGYDPITGEPIWDDESMNTPAPPTLPTLPNNPVIDEPEVDYDISVYMSSTDPLPDGAILPDVTHQGIKLSDPEVYQILAGARWAAQSRFATSAVVLLVVDDVNPATAPRYYVDLSVEPVKISSATN